MGLFSKWVDAGPRTQLGPLLLNDDGSLELDGGPTFRGMQIHRMHLGDGVYLDASPKGDVALTLSRKVARAAGIPHGKHRFRRNGRRWFYKQP